MSIHTFTLPDLGEGLTEADIIRWLVAAGDPVAVDQPVVEVETAKSLVEVPSPFGGTVATLHAEAGTTLEVGRPLISVDDGTGGTSEATGAPVEGAQSYAEEELAGARPEAAAAAAAPEAEDDAGSGNVLIGYGTPGGAASGRTRRRKLASGAPTVAPSAPATAAETPGEAAAPAPAPARAGTAPEARPAPRVVNPLVRRLAREHGVDLASVAGSGPGGLIMRADVLAAASGGAGAQAGSPLAPELTGQAGQTGQPAVSAQAGQTVPDADLDPRTGLGVAGVVPVSGVRKVTAAAMSRSRREIPEATVWVDVDVSPLIELRESMKARGDGQVPGLLAFASRFALAGLARFPELAMRFEEDGDGGHRIVSFDGINLGFAVQTERGLVVPSVRGAHALNARQLDAELRRLTEVARSGRGTPQELSGGTFTINNYGVFGTDGSAAIINHPEVAILGLGRIIDRAWVVDGELAVRKVMQLSLVFDHRVCDGGTAGGFLRFVADCLENPAGVLADL